VFALRSSASASLEPFGSSGRVRRRLSRSRLNHTPTTCDMLTSRRRAFPLQSRRGHWPPAAGGSMDPSAKIFEPSSRASAGRAEPSTLSRTAGHRNWPSCQSLVLYAADPRAIPKISSPGRAALRAVTRKSHRERIRRSSSLAHRAPPALRPLADSTGCVVHHNRHCPTVRSRVRLERANHRLEPSASLRPDPHLDPGGSRGLDPVSPGSRRRPRAVWPPPAVPALSSPYRRYEHRRNTYRTRASPAH